MCRVVEMDLCSRIGPFIQKKGGLRLKKLEYAKIQTQTGLVCWVCNLHGPDPTLQGWVRIFFILLMIKSIKKVLKLIKNLNVQSIKY